MQLVDCEAAQYKEQNVGSDKRSIRPRKGQCEQVCGPCTKDDANEKGRSGVMKERREVVKAPADTRAQNYADC